MCSSGRTLRSLLRPSFSIVMFSFIAGAMACSVRPAAPGAGRGKVSAARGGAATVTVSRRGDTLSSIAKRFTGKASNWKKIAKANPGLDPQRIRLGQLVTIPDHLLPEGSRRGGDAKLLLVSAKPGDVSRQLISSGERASLPSSIREESLTEPEAEWGAPPRSSGRGALRDGVPPGGPERAGKRAKAGVSSGYSRARKISSSGYGSLNREVYRLDAELAKAEALAAEARRQQAAAEAALEKASESEPQAGGYAGGSEGEPPGAFGGASSCSREECSKSRE